jgi:molybdopterin synthase catalytic subunit
MESVHITIQDGPIAQESEVESCHECGALIEFLGIVRSTEDARSITGLEYTAYEQMAQRVLETIAQEMIARFEITWIRAEHSRGFVPVGECSFRLCVGAPHRKEALLAVGEFIDRMKEDVPIWKAAVFQDGVQEKPVEQTIEQEDVYRS